MTWVILGLLGALCTALTTILAKIGIKDVKSNFATFFRTGVVIIFSFLICLISGNIFKIPQMTFDNYLFLALSGIATGLSWLCYYRALKLGDVNKVTPIDKSSYILTSILFLIFFFPETTKNGDLLTIIMLFVSMALMLVGTFLMINKKQENKEVKNTYLIYAILSAVFASLVSLFVKMGLKGIPSDVGTFFRTIIVFVFAGAIVLAKKDYKGAKSITKKSWLFLTLSGVATGGAWLFEYTALNMQGVNLVAVNSISKLSILLTMLLSFIFLKEKFDKKSIIGLSILTLGIVTVIVFSL